LVEWEDPTWQALAQAYQAAATASVQRFSEEWKSLRALLTRCLDTGSLDPLAEQGKRQQGERSLRIRHLEQSLEQGEMSFDGMALSGFGSAAPLGADGMTAEVNEVGMAGGGAVLRPVTTDQAVRGRLAELFVLEVCWRRFLALDADGRANVLDEIASRRENGPGEVPWGTAVAWKRLRRRLDEDRDALLSCQADSGETSIEMARLFKALIEVAVERGPGFDVLDPFGVWGEVEDGAFSPCRVEVKAILPPEEGLDGHRVVLSTNEFHRARLHPESYILRLIYVPRGTDTKGVRWACDVPDPVGVLRLNEQIVVGVRSGMLPFLVRARGGQPTP
jgi:hypothetical protein